MPFQRLRLAGTLTGLVLMAGCAGHITTEVETTGMANPEVALRRSMDLVNNQMGELNGLRSVRPIPAMVALPASVAPVGAAPGQAVVTVPRMPIASASTVTIAPVTATPPAIAPLGSPPVTAFPPPTRSGAVVPEELQRPIGFAWSGSLDDGVRKVAAEVGYRVEVSGPLQPQPLAVAVPNVATTLIGALTTLGNQAGSAATVRVDPINRRIEVIHHV
jgi:defect-in-organelle-trafficking protein DotD